MAMPRFSTQSIPLASFHVKRELRIIIEPWRSGVRVTKLSGGLWGRQGRRRDNSKAGIGDETQPGSCACTVSDAHLGKKRATEARQPATQP